MKQKIRDVARNREAVLPINSGKTPNKEELWDSQDSPEIIDARRAVRHSNTTRQERIPPSISNGTNQARSRGNNKKICWQFRSLLQKRLRHKKRKGPSRSEQIPQVIVQIRHIWEATERKYPRCWDKPCKTKHQWADANRTRGRVKTLREEKPPRQQPR